MSDVVLTSELVAQGHTQRSIRHLIRDGVLTRLRHGSYADASLWATLSEVDRHRLLVRAVVKRRKGTYAVSHYSALAEHGVDLWGVDLQRVQLTHADSVGQRNIAGVDQHRGDLDLTTTTTIDGIRFVGAARACLETAATHDTEVGVVVVNSALNKGIATSDEFNERYAVVRRWPGALRLQLVKRLADSRLQSVAESRFWYLCQQAGLPMPEPQVEVRDEFGNLIGIVDFLWRELGVFLEFDGKIKYSTFRRDGETLEQYLMREKRREEKICAITGWVCIRITWADLENPKATVRRIRALLESRRTLAG